MTAFVSAVLFVLFSLGLPAFAVDVTGNFQWNHFCSDVQSLGPAKVVLDAGKLNGNVLYNGSFSIPNVPVGAYILSVVSHDYAFDQLRIDVSESAFRVHPCPFGTPFNPPSSIVLPNITLTPRQKLEYIVPPESFNLLGMLQSPMMLMLIFGGAMVVAMPYLQRNMDPETIKEFREQQGKLSQVQNAMTSGDLKAGFSALMADEPSPKAPPASPAASKSRNAKGKRR
ncbi:hypothetical protein GGX14DRAFT_422450 [Mycena pura]|uniref:ER membrane protein complex subunit 7 beta-sandwich domain-containing protein n=1 Tax=Mycena pura TaxID=153505 RepID=A0AAD6YPV2_9AGAR|nr:hypothetical protein GGX14DRAFT_422450 [Mycena pura]